MKKKKPTVKILVGYHRPAVLLKDEVLTPIHLGRALATEASKDGSMSKEDYQWMLDNMIGDDTGENISEENRKYCELTALYWAWKNYDKLGNPDYIGFMQYRRHFIFDDGFDGTGREKPWGCFRFSGIDDSYVDMLSLRGDKIVAYLEKHPADVLTTKEVSFGQTVAEHYAQTLSFLNPDDLRICARKAALLFPEYKSTIRKYLRSKKHYWYHSFIMKKEIFFEYCEWLFKILFATEKEIDYQDYTIAAYRTPAYLGERLWGIFFNGKKNVCRTRELELSIVDDVSRSRDIRPAFERSNTAICFACDDNYVPYLSVVLQSLTEHAGSGNNYDIVIIENGVEPYNQKLLTETYAGGNVSIRFYNVSDVYEKYKEMFYSHGYYTPTVYFRFFIPEIFAHYEKVLYLDSDLICLRDIADLYRVDIGGNLLGAVRDVEYARIYNENCEIKGYRVKDYCDDILKLKDYTHYFNSGVLGFNIKKCREFALTDKLLKRLAEVKNPMIVDQDIFNSVCEGRVFYYSPDWNVEWHTYYLYGNLLPYQLPRDFYEKYLKVIKNPSILHYAVDMKPWDCPEHSTAEIFWHYAQKTPFFARIIYKHFEQKIYALSRQKPEKAAVRAAEVQKIPLKDKLKYYRYKFLSFAAFGSKKSYYGEKKRKMKQKIKSIRSRELSAC